jgi:hypothetical protein
LAGHFLHVKPSPIDATGVPHGSTVTSTRAFTRGMAEVLAALHHGSSGSGDSSDHHHNNNGGVKAPPLLQGNQWK